MADTKACGCRVGHCRLDALLDAMVAEVLAGRERPDLQRAIDELQDTCCGGWRAVLPKDRDE